MHLIVTVHGMWGVSNHMNAIVNSIREKFGQGVVIQNSRVNTFFNTYHGIDQCGRRLHTEVLNCIGDYNALHAPDNISSISFIGYSAGGLIARYCVGLLHAEGFFDKVTPTHFVTIATPHMGIRWTSRRVSGRLFNFFADQIVNLYAGRTGLQLALADATESCRVPLLLEMMTPGSIYFEAWKLFHFRYVYSNASNDNIVPYCTSSLSTHNKWRSGGGRGGNSKLTSDGHSDENVSLLDLQKYKHLLDCVRVDGDRTEIVLSKPPECSMSDLLCFALLALVFSPLFLLHALLVMLPLRIVSLCSPPSPPSSDTRTQPICQVASDSLPIAPCRDQCPWLILQHARTIPVYRVSVHIQGIHTHALIICRHSHNPAGAEVIRHLVEEVLTQGQVQQSIHSGDGEDDSGNSVESVGVVITG